MTTSTARKRTTTVPAFDNAEQIAAAVAAHNRPERADHEAADAITAIARQIRQEEAEDWRVRAGDVFDEARQDGDWARYRAALERDVEAAERTRRRNQMLSDIERQRQHLIGEFSKLKQHRADAGHLTLSYLADALPPILAAAQALDLHGVPDDAVAAMSSGAEVVGKYNAAVTVVDAYAALRRAQAQAVQHISRVELKEPDDLDVTRNGQFSDALHLDAVHLGNRRQALHQLRSEADRNHVRLYAPGAREFFDEVPPTLFGALTTDGFPAEYTTAPARARWLARWSRRLEFIVPTWAELHELRRVFTAAMRPTAWRDRDGLIVHGGLHGEPAPDNAEAVALANLDYQRPDWDAREAEPEAEPSVKDAVRANARAARTSEHPAYKH